MLTRQIRIQEREQTASLGSDLGNAIGRLKSLPISHPFLEAARDEAFASIQHSGSNLMTLIVGPPKAGTTVLARKGLTERINRHHTGEDNPENSAVLYLSLTPSGAGEFNWKNLDFQILQKLNDPLAKATTTAKPPVAIPSYDRAGPLFREAVEDGLARRQIKVLILDHGHHLILASGGPKLSEQLERILAMGTASDLHVVLVANLSTYQALDCSGHLASSINVVHLPRYNWGNQREEHEFRKVLKTFHNKRILDEKSTLPQSAKPAISFQLEDEAMNIYRNTFGLVGLTKELLVTTLARAQAKGCQEVDQKAFRTHMPTGRHLLPLAGELSAYEAKSGDDQKLLEVDHWLFSGRPMSEEEGKRKGGDIQRAPGRDRVGLPEELRQ
jgi:hypothetical protein